MTTSHRPCPADLLLDGWSSSRVAFAGPDEQGNWSLVLTDSGETGPGAAEPGEDEPAAAVGGLRPVPPPASLGLQVQGDGERATLALRGELDVATSGLLDALLDDLLRTRRSPRLSSLVVDTAGVTFADAAGISPLLHARAVLHRRGGTFEVRDPSPAVLRLLTLLGLTALVVVPGPPQPAQTA
ncbi:anti-anti-sigma factor [Motilibacter rhizosphaerae]|uniref:Anti-anti-sigma factor n=1 Tax=Motilibacter rhizosphaerae TaxID=598652 RepID=A0A4V2F4C1_9ACTN|nr:STAS domain-containing protein [Motilibacter rhizosphaerae]RZS87087.1 anti-anti-sigma factor [Motilibacter rhizosphaerae]